MNNEYVCLDLTVKVKSGISLLGLSDGKILRLWNCIPINTLCVKHFCIQSLLITFYYHVMFLIAFRCIVGKVIFGVIVLISTIYGALDIIFTIYDIKSEKTKQTVTTGLFNMFITALWYVCHTIVNVIKPTFWLYTDLTTCACKFFKICPLVLAFFF